MSTPNLPPLPAEFRSGNSVPVERATVTRERMAEIQLAAYQAGRDAGLCDAEKVVLDGITSDSSIAALCARRNAAGEICALQSNAPESVVLAKLNKEVE